MANVNQNRGPWCVICGSEMNRPNHRFQFLADKEDGYTALPFNGEVLPGFEPVYGENCLEKAQSRRVSTRNDT